MHPGDAVAIVGYSYRMPGGIRTDEDLWHLLSARETIQEPIIDRYGRGYRPIGGFSGPGRFASPYEGLIRDGEELLFDHRFFGMSLREAENTDPQTRLLLTCTWETFEQVGWDLHALHNSPTGVFIGAQAPVTGSWRPMHGMNEYSNAGISLAMQANRISYYFNLKGPSMSCCTACSAGLSALHLAMNALRCGDCEQAVIGSSNYLGGPTPSLGFNALGVISPDGKCYSFDRRANGYMRSEGVFVYAVKPLAAAEHDGDPIHAVVQATAINTAGGGSVSDGIAPRSTIFTPSRITQVELMQRAGDRAGLTPPQFDYLEAHATGTPVGDPIEANAIADVFGGIREEASPLRISSIKSNVGHMEAAAFHCSLLKVLLMMKRRTFAPISRNFLELNPEIDLQGGNLRVQTACEPFPHRPVVVGINSFGFGGANGHCVVREYPAEGKRVWSEAVAPEAGYVIPLSARTEEALIQSARELLGSPGLREADLYTLAGNLSRRRTHFRVRTAFAVLDREELIEKLKAFAGEGPPPATVSAGERRLTMVFSGQGTQWAGCGRALYDSNPVFRRVVDAIEEHWRQHSEVSLRHACFHAPQAELNECQLAQPSIFMIQCALLELLKTWAVYPDCVVGHSSGEVAAAYACGALSMEDATRLVYHRATLQQRRAGTGRMLAIGLNRQGVEQLLDGPIGEGIVEIACENAPASTVVCGRESTMRRIKKELDRHSLQSRLLPGNIAFHSAAMDVLEDDTLAALSFLEDRPFDADVPWVSSVTGEMAERTDSRYWWSNIRQPVRFAAAMETVHREYRPDVVLEIAPHGALQGSIAQCLAGTTAPASCIPTLMRDTDPRTSFNQALGALYRAGVTLDFAAQFPGTRPMAHLLPGHPRDETPTLDLQIDDRMFVRGGEYSHGPLVGHRIPCDHGLFEARLSEKDFPWLLDHRVYQATIVPAAAYIEMILEALGGPPLHFEEVEFVQACAIPKVPVRLQTALYPVENTPEEFTFSISSRSFDAEAEGQLHCRGRVRRLKGEGELKAPRELSELDRTGYQPAGIVKAGDFYERLEAVLGDDFEYGPSFRTVQSVDAHGQSMELLSEVVMDAELWSTGREEGYVLPPPLMDGGLQMYLYYLVSDLSTIPRRVRGLTVLRSPTSPRVTCHLSSPLGSGDWESRGSWSLLGEHSCGGIGLYDTDTGLLAAYMEDYVCFNSSRLSAEVKNSKQVISWQPKALPPGERLVERCPEGEIDPGSLIAALGSLGHGDRFACHVVEFAGSLKPDQTALKQYLDSPQLGPGHLEFWLLSDSEECARAHYEVFAHERVPLRFDCMDLGAGGTGFPEGKLLRPGAAELLLIHWRDGCLDKEVWDFLHRLTVPRGLALVYHGEDGVVGPVPGWIKVRAGRRRTLLQAEGAFPGRDEPTDLPAPRWVLGEPGSFARDWASIISGPEVYLIPYDDIPVGADGELEGWPKAGDLRAVDFFCGMDATDPTGEEVVSRFIAFIQALVARRAEKDSEVCRVTVVTHLAAFGVENPRGSGLWGAVRSMAAEIAEAANLQFRLVDMGALDDLPALAGLWGCDFREREMAVRGGRLYVPRVTRIEEDFPHVPQGDDSRYRLCLDNPGSIGGLRMKTCEPGEPGPKDVEVEVAAAGLNFRDLMVTLDLLPMASYEWSMLGREVGMEASGIVRRAGPEVRRFEVGDEVVFMKGGCIANLTVLDEDAVFPKPGCLSMVEAAAALSAYVTAYYALVRLAGLRKGRRVLIHSAMGGVGQAAMAIAGYMGAEIFATAGNEGKRERLRARGARNAFDSRSYDWYEGLMEATGGEGVDVVLNSLTGRHMDLCVRALRPGGWHCEIGKVDIYAGSRLGLGAFRKNLHFVGVDVDRLGMDDPKLLVQLVRTCLELIEQGALPPLPVTSYPYKDYRGALQLMMSGQHEGKLVLEAPTRSGDSSLPVTDCRPFLDPDATYLVTGGLGGLGMKLLLYLAGCGARHLTLMDRASRGRRSEEWVRRASALGRLFPDCEVHVVPGDVAVDEDVKGCMARLQRPLKGVFHLAGVLDDRALPDMSADSVARVFAPKARGALFLHKATAEYELDHFVLFSSIASTFGNPGQVNYSAASAFLDGLAAHRRRQGLPGLSYNLAGVADTGMASRDLHVLRRMRAVGVLPVSTEVALGNLDYAMRMMSDENHLITASFKGSIWNSDSSDYLRSGRLIGNQDAFKLDTSGRLAVDNVLALLAGRVSELIGHEVDVDEALYNLGLSSISVVELGAFCQELFNYRVSVLDLLSKASTRSLASAIAQGETGEGTGDETEGEADTPDDGQAWAVQQPARRVPSAFGNRLEDHFPDGMAVAGDDLLTDS